MILSSLVLRWSSFLCCRFPVIFCFFHHPPFGKGHENGHVQLVQNTDASTFSTTTTAIVHPYLTVLVQPTVLFEMTSIKRRLDYPQLRVITLLKARYDLPIPAFSPTLIAERVQNAVARLLE